MGAPADLSCPRRVTLVEFLPPELAPAYLEAFGRAGLPTLDAKLR